MKITIFSSNFRNILTSLIIVMGVFFCSTRESFSSSGDLLRNDHNGVRDASIDNNGYCQTETIKFDPLSNNRDVVWELDNPTCIAFGVSAGAVLISSELATNFTCNQFSPKLAKDAKDLFVQRSGGIYATVQTLKRKFAAAGSCSNYTAQCSGSNFIACGQAAACCSSFVASSVALGVATSELALIWKAAVDSQKNAHICGANWNTWQQIDAGDIENGGINDYQQGSLPGDKMYVYGKKAHSYQDALEQDYKNGLITPDITNKRYREYIYGGMEFEDNDGDFDFGDDIIADKSTGAGCELPKWSKEKLERNFGYSTGRQRYYMRGPKVASNYACSRFLLRNGSNEEKKSARDAYECCKKRSQETLCIEESSSVNPFDPKKHRFCKLGERCKVQNVWYEIHPAKNIPNYVCASTYSVCPYNLNLGGGTEFAEFAPDHQDIMLNHCQYLNHCAKKSDVPYIRTSNLDGGWISSACFDLKGDSQNNFGFTADLVPVNTKNFSAPIAQCFKETLENIFINKAGHTQCKNPDEEPDQNDNCVSGYAYKSGQIIEGQQSFFQKIQDNLQLAIKLVMTIAITVMGVGVLLTGTPWDKKTIIMFVIKLGLVSYFALGTAWQDYFFEGVSTASTSLSKVFMRIDQSETPNKLDGCQFPRYNYLSYQQDAAVIDYQNPAYPPGKDYLEIWDTLDCKIAMALGFAPSASVPNLILVILAGFLTNGLGIIFFAATFIFAFYLLALTVRALHIFLISSMAITIMIYVSPITITASLFKRTEGMFKTWRTHLIGFVLQPVILFVYLGIFIAVFEQTVMGDATFYGNDPANPKQIDCSVGNAENNSLYCIFQFNSIKTNNSLAPMGIALPVLFNMNPEKVTTITKGAFLIFVFAKFLDKILDFAAKMIGGNTFSSGSKGGLEALGKAFGMAKSVQTRGTNATRKWGGKVARKTGSAAAKIGAGAIGVSRAISSGKSPDASSGGSSSQAAGSTSSAAASPPTQSNTPAPANPKPPTG